MELLALYLWLSPKRWFEIENIRAEHGHRLLAGALGISLLALVIGAVNAGADRRTKALAFVALHAYLAQAALGGLTVILFLRVSVYHAVLAQVVFGLLVALTYRLSRVDDVRRPNLRIAPVLTAALYVQILLGALVRHHHAWDAMPTFPLPLWPDRFTGATTLHLAHRLGALAVAIVLVLAVMEVRRLRPDLRRLALSMVAWVVAQIALGGAIVWTKRIDTLATTHVAVGSLLVASSIHLTLRSRRGIMDMA